MTNRCSDFIKNIRESLLRACYRDAKGCVNGILKEALADWASRMSRQISASTISLHYIYISHLLIDEVEERLGMLLRLLVMDLIF